MHEPDGAGCSSPLANALEELAQRLPRAVLPDCEHPRRVAEVVALVLGASDVYGAKLHVFGSAVNGFGDASSDVDLVLEASREQLVEALGLGDVRDRNLVPQALKALQKRFRKHRIFVEQRVLGAKVPILKLWCGNTACDLSVNNLLPAFNTRLLKAYADIDGRAVKVVQEAKSWARQEGVHGAAHGNLSSYALTLMVIFYMQVRGALPCLQRNASERPEWYCEGDRAWNVAMDLTRYSDRPQVQVSFQDFARFYYAEFRWGTWVVSVRTGQCAVLNAYPDLKVRPRTGVAEAESASMLHIEDPFDVSRNLNCVLKPGSNYRLWCALEQPARQSRTVPGVGSGRARPQPR